MACATIAVPACCRICARDRLAVSVAKSASWMRERAELRFSAVVLRLAITDSKRFWIAPKVLRRVLTEVRAESTLKIAEFDSATVCTFTLLKLPLSTAELANPCALLPLIVN